MKKPVAEIFLLKKKTIISVPISKNNSVEKIIGQLFDQKQVCDQKLLQKMVCDRKASDAEKINDRDCAKTKRVYDRNKSLFFITLCEKIVVDGKDCLQKL